MCIRDSFITTALAAQNAVDLPRMGIANALVNFTRQLGGAPVSYTHLRAHETVLDLVCRLLLEKKKHTP